MIGLARGDGVGQVNVSYLVDGIETRNARFGSSDLHPSIRHASVQDLEVQTDAFSAEYGRSSAVMNARRSKSGANSLHHGDAYEFIRNSGIQANDFFYDGQSLPFLCTPRTISAQRWEARGSATRLSSSWLRTEGFRSRAGEVGEATVPHAAGDEPGPQCLPTPFGGNRDFSHYQLPRQPAGGPLRRRHRSR